MGSWAFLHRIGQRYTSIEIQLGHTMNKKQTSKHSASILFLIMALLTISIMPGKGQNITCADFTILSVAPDTVDPNTAQITIQFNDTATMIASYPHVSGVLDCNGDTVATGSMFYFAQLGQTTQDYPVTLSGSLSCLPLSMVFVFGNDLNATDTCLLTFGNSTGVSTAANQPLISCYPNPTIDKVYIEVPAASMGDTFLLCDNTGKLIRKGCVTAERLELNLMDLPDGMYFFNLLSGKRTTVPILKAQGTR